MNQQTYKYLYGPVYSWRLGMSLGVDPLSDRHKICNLDCIYCQLGKTNDWKNERREFVATHEIINEIMSLQEVHIDYLTICGRGEPTLARNLGCIINSLREIRSERIAVITNSTLMHDEKVRRDLALSDFVIAKLDAFNQESFLKVDKAKLDLDFKKIVEGIKAFRKSYRGKLALQIMFVDENKNYAKEIAQVAQDIHANEIEINTPLRPCMCQPLSEEELMDIKVYFRNLPAITVYEKEKKHFKPMNERETIQRHGNYKKTTANSIS